MQGTHASGGVAAPPPPRVTVRRVVGSLRGPGQSPVLPFACSNGRGGGWSTPPPAARCQTGTGAAVLHTPQSRPNTRPNQRHHQRVMAKAVAGQAPPPSLGGEWVGWTGIIN